MNSKVHDLLDCGLHTFVRCRHLESAAATEQMFNGSHCENSSK